MALMLVFSACGVPLGGTRYIPADSTADPFASIRAKAEQYYQAGLTDERTGNWNKALDDFRQASQWDHDERQDIANALSRAQAQVDWESYRKVTSRLVTPVPVTPTAPAESVTPNAIPPQGTVGSSTVNASTKRFVSLRYPYIVSVPRDWTTENGGTAQLPADVFNGTSDEERGALVMIMVEPADFGISLDQFYYAIAKSLKSNGVNDVEIVDRRKVAGMPCYVLSYLDSTDNGLVAVRHVIFVTPGKAWHVILLATPSITASLNSMLDSMLDSFEFQASAFPVQ